MERKRKESIQVWSEGRVKEKEKKKDGVEIREKKKKKKKGNLRLGVETREKCGSGDRWVLMFIYIYITEYFEICHRIF